MSIINPGDNIRAGSYTAAFGISLARKNFKPNDSAPVEDQIREIAEEENIPADIRETVVQNITAWYAPENINKLIQEHKEQETAGWNSVLQDLQDSDSFLGREAIGLATELHKEVSKLLPLVELIEQHCEKGTPLPDNISKELPGINETLNVFKKLSIEQREDFITRLKNICNPDKEIRNGVEAKEYIEEYISLLPAGFSIMMSKEARELLTKNFGEQLQKILSNIKPEDLPDFLDKATVEQVAKHLSNNKPTEALKTVIGEKNLSTAKDWLTKSLDFINDNLGIDVGALLGLDKGWGNGWGKFITGGAGAIISGLGLFLSNDKGKGLFSGIGGLVLGGLASGFKEVRTITGGPITLGKNSLQTGWLDGWGKWILTGVSGLTAAYGIGSSEEKSSSILTTLGSAILGSAIGSSSNTVRTGLGVPTNK